MTELTTYEDKFYNATPKMVKATRDWVEQFSNIPQQILNDLLESGNKEYDEIYNPLYSVTCQMINDCGSCKQADNTTPAEYTELYEDDEEMYEDCKDSYTHWPDKPMPQCDAEDERRNEDAIPIWGTLFQPQSYDRKWFRNNAQTIYEETGVLVYDNEYYDIMLGINSAGHCFYQSYWIPLYKLRGLKWHE